MNDKNKLKIVLLLASIFLMVSATLGVSISPNDLSPPTVASTSIPPFSIIDKRTGINSYVVTFNNPDHALINVSIANYTTVHNFSINNTTSIPLTIYANTIILAYWGNIEIGSLTLFYTSSIPTISVTSNSTENFVVIKVPQINVFTVTISLKSTVIFSSILSLPATDLVYERYDAVTYINVTTQNFTAASYEVLPPSVPQYEYNISISLNDNSTYSISYSTNMPSELLIYSGSSLIENETINGSGIFYISTQLNATSLILIHDNSTVLIKGFPPVPVQPVIRNIYHNATIIQVERIVNVEYVALSFVAGIAVAFVVAMIMKRRMKNEQ